MTKFQIKLEVETSIRLSTEVWRQGAGQTTTLEVEKSTASR